MTRKRFVEGRGYSKADWDAVSEDGDASVEDMAKARPFAEVFPELAASARRARGAQRAPTKKLVSLRLSQDVIDRFKADGPGWQTRIDEALRKASGL
jgi:uncharacterized protein (DUF4415 family)